MSKRLTYLDTDFDKLQHSISEVTPYLGMRLLF